MKRYVRANDINIELQPYLAEIDNRIADEATLGDLRTYITQVATEADLSDNEANYLEHIARRRLRAHEIDKEIEKDPASFYGLPKGSYSVSAYTDPFGELVDSKIVSTPEAAINKWCQLQKKYPTCAMITGYHSDAQALKDWAVDNQDQLATWHKMYHVPYKLDWLIHECEKPTRALSSKYDAPDQIHPFGLG